MLIEQIIELKGPLNTCEMKSNGIKTAFFQKITKNRQAAGAFAPRPPSVISFNYSTLLYSTASPNLDNFAPEC